jgi:hypothetical protein
MDEWITINGYPDYAVNNKGLIKSLRFNRLLSPSANNNGYLYVNLVKDRRKKSTAVHKLVIEHFGSPQPASNWVVDHKDSNKQNNELTNLEWVSISENTKRAYGNQDKRTKAVELRSLGWTYDQIAKEIGMSRSFVQAAILDP